MSDQLKIAGVITVTPQTGSLLSSGAESTQAPLNVQMSLAQKEGTIYDLVSDAAKTVDLGGCTSVHAVTIFTNRPIVVALTSSLGVALVPVDDSMILISKTVPFTAITLTRTPATETLVRVFIGQKTS